MSLFADTLSLCKDLLRPYREVPPKQYDELDGIINTLFTVMDECPPEQAALTDLASQILMCLSEDPAQWSNQLTLDFNQVLDEFLEYTAAPSIDDDLDDAPFVVFRPTQGQPHTPPASELSTIDDLTIEFVKESKFLLSKSVDIIFQYESSLESQFLTEATVSLRQIVASALLLEQTVFAQASQALISLLEHVVAVDIFLSENFLSDILFSLESLNDLLSLYETGVRISQSSVIDIHSKIDNIIHSLPPRPPSTTGPSEEIIETYEIFRPQKRTLSATTIEFLDDFIDESSEHLQSAEDCLIEIQNNGTTVEQVSTIFRAIHTIKGAAGFLILTETEKLTHATENFLVQIRDQELPLTPQGISFIFKTINALQINLQNLSEHKAESIPNMDSLITEATSINIYENAQATQQDSPPKNISAKAPKIDQLRVKLSAMDRMLALVGELTITKNKLQEHLNHNASPHLETIFDNFKATVRDLEHIMLSVRLQPISLAFRKLPHLVREVALQSGKKANLIITGEHYEIDKRILEGLQDALLHLVRNAIDHGIEKPEKREQLGKKAEGQLKLLVSQAEGQFVVKISDDGCGIDPQKLLQKAINKQIVTHEEGKRLSHRQILELIYHPGFSTKESTSKLSGRGVGMDVVRSAIERLGGVVDLQSEVNVGTQFSLRIPLTLTVLSVLTIPYKDTRYLLPRHNLIEIIQSSLANIDTVNGQLILQHENGQIPLTTLATVIKAPSLSSTHIVVCSVGERQFALGVPAIEGFQEVITQQLNSQITQLPILDGASLLEDGSIALILSALGVANTLSNEFRPRLQEAQSQQKFDIFIEVWCPTRHLLRLESIQSIQRLPTPHIFESGWGNIVWKDEEIITFSPTEMTNIEATHLIICNSESGLPYAIPIQRVGNMLNIPISAVSEEHMTINMEALSVSILSVPEIPKES